jgi:hypothetical protein
MSRARWTQALALAALFGACAESSALGPGATPLPRAADADELWSMIPAEADLVLWANLAKLRTSPWTRESFERVAGAEAGNAAVGLEQMREVERVVFAKVPTLGEGATILVARGAIQREAMIEAFAREGAESASYRDAQVFSRDGESLALLGKRTAISGLTVAVRAALDCNFGAARTLEAEPWFERMRSKLVRGHDPARLVAAMYVRLPPATRATLMREMGEGGSLEEVAGRVDLGDDLDLTAWGNVRDESEARDLAGRLAERVRDVRVRPIVFAFGFGSLLDALVLEPKGSAVLGRLHVSRNDRERIAARMAATAEMMAKLRTLEEKRRP